MSKKEMLNAVRGGATALVEQLLMNDPSLLKEVVMRETWLNHAAGKNQISIMNLLVERGIPVDGDKKCDSPLVSAISSGANEAVRWLIKHGAKVDGSKEDAAPLSMAILRNDIDTVKLLLRNDARTDITWGHLNYSPLTFSESFGDERKEIFDILKGKPRASLTSLAVDDCKSPYIKHLEEYYGTPDKLKLSKIVCDFPVSIYTIATPDGFCKVLATEGMSAKAMTVPEELKDFKYAELMMFLPDNWPIDDESLKKNEFSWPFEWLQRLAYYPHENKTFLGGRSATFSNGEPPDAITEGTELSAFLALSQDVQSDQFIDQSGKKVQIYKVIPIFKEELEFQRKNGTGLLLERFAEFNIPTTIDLERINTCK